MQRHHHDHEKTTGRPAANLIWRIASHITVILAAVLLVLFLIDQATRGEMSFLCNQATKWMLFALCALSILNAVAHLSSLARLRAVRKYLLLLKRQSGRARSPHDED